MPDIRIEHISKSFSGTKVLDDVSFTVRDKELVTLLGPSGCGKTTTLLSIAGFQTPDAGRIGCGDDVFFDRDARIDLAAERRNLGMVFQSYAIWPHMTVAQNLAFPLRIRKMSKAAIRERVAAVLDLVELGSLAGRYPHQLSGGQQQRVALARAIAYSPTVLLLDEPFSNLDAKLRERARDWLRELQHTLGLTTIVVTHDQDEALSMSDRILVIDGGRILRDATPEETYRQPRVRFVADFLGQCNFLAGAVTPGPDGSSIVKTAEFADGVTVTEVYAGPSGTIAVRPEDIEINEVGIPGEPDEHGSGSPGMITDATFLGDHYQYRVVVGSVQLSVRAQRALAHGPVRVRIRPGVATFVK